MLTDTERKIHRILSNFSVGRRRMPSMGELMVKTGRSIQDIRKTLVSLEDKLFIIWDNKKQTESIKLLQAWEQQPKSEPIKPTGNLDYWTNY